MVRGNRSKIGHPVGDERAENERLRQIIKELQRHRFGRRAESLPVDQLLLGLEEAEQIEAEGFVSVNDALKTLTIPVIELHLSNPATREAYRHHSYVSEVATGVIAGFGAYGYELAVQAALTKVRERG